MRRSNKGMSLIELMVAIAIIALIAAVAIPGLLSSKRASNATAAFANLKSFSTSMSAYIEKQSDQSYPEEIDNIGDYYTHLPKKGGYNYYYLSDVTRFIYYAYPDSLSNGTKIFFVDESSHLFEAGVDTENYLIPPTVNLFTTSENRIIEPNLTWEKKS
ncbi:MAG: prepilin-type N-terminal cleavage/methylation domain-containing protein [Candidatus Brocadiae bacterium]|nr:prepilin-type N-terminal cleavage/methylation domain-containing protein [Candidatus Brocadiia bacterium]